MKLITGFGLRLATTLVAACMLSAPLSAQEKPDPISVRLDWTTWGGHAAMHLAQNKGWYKDANLDVSLEDGNGSVTTVQIVGSGDAFDVGHAALATMMIARDKGLPVKAVAPFARKSDIGVLVPEDSGIDGPAGLKGKKIVYTAGSLEAPFMDAFLANGDLKRSDVELLNVEAASKVATYAANRADAVVSTIPFVFGSVNAQRASKPILFADYGLNMPSFGLFSNEKKLAEKADAIGRFASVTARAWQYIYDGHQDEAVEAILAERPQARLDPKALRGHIDGLAYYFDNPTAGKPFGAPVPADWEEAVATLSEVGLISDKLPAADFYVTDLVDTQKYDQLVEKK